MGMLTVSFKIWKWHHKIEFLLAKKKKWRMKIHIFFSFGGWQKYTIVSTMFLALENEGSKLTHLAFSGLTKLHDMRLFVKEGSIKNKNKNNYTGRPGLGGKTVG